MRLNSRGPQGHLISLDNCLPMSETNSLPVVILACKVFQNLLEQYLTPELAEQVTFLDYGLHKVPRNLKKTLQEQIDAIPQPSLVVLGYGLCGNGLHGLKAGPHTLLAPRVDDCIALLLGSRDAYIEQFNNAPGTYYLSKGWLESGSNPLQESHELEAKYGPEQAEWLMDQQYRNYKRVAFVAHQQSDLDQYRAQALLVAEYCKRWGMTYQEILGTDAYVRRIAQVAGDLGLVEHDFILVPPGGQLEQGQYLV